MKLCVACPSPSHTWMAEPCRWIPYFFSCATASTLARRLAISSCLRAAPSIACAPVSMGLAAAQVSEPPGKVIKPNSWKSIQDEGMPVHGRPYEKGNMYIHFKVVFPEELSQEQVGALRSVLPGPKPSSSLNGSMDVDAEQVRALPCGRLSRVLSIGAGAVRRSVYSPPASARMAARPLSRSASARSVGAAGAVVRALTVGPTYNVSLQ